MGGALSPTGWTCLEWQLPSPSGDVHVWLDGNEVTSLGGSGVSFSFALPYLALGADTDIDSGYAADLWMDDLVVSTQRVGCTN